MATLINKLLGKKTVPEDPHTRRYEFDFNQMPSVSECGIATVFKGENALFYSYLRKYKSDLELISSVRFRTFKVREGKIAILTFPDPIGSPEVKYSICIYRTEEVATFSDIYKYSSPYYIMAKVLDKWAIGEITPLPGHPGEFVTTYYKTIDSPNLHMLVDWVMKKEDLSIKDKNYGNNNQ